MTATATYMEHEIGGEGLFVLRLRDGAARLRGVDGDTVRVTAEEDLEEVFRVERGNGSLSLIAANTFEIHIGRGRHSPDLDVDVPRRATVVIEATSASVSSDGLSGDQRYQTVSGDVSLTSVAGAIVAEAVSGDVRLLARGALDLQARTVSGDLEVRAGRIDRLAAGTTSGDVRVAGELDPGGTHRIETVSGDMLLALAGGVRLVATTVAGDVRSTLPHRSEGGRGQRVLIVGDGAATLETRSMSGSVKLVEAQHLDRTAHVTPPVPPVPPAARPEAAPTVPADSDPIGPSTRAIAAAYDEARMRILRSLERGEIDVTEAGARLGRLDAGSLAETDR
jgi:hypothetical protein